MAFPSSRQQVAGQPGAVDTRATAAAQPAQLADLRATATAHGRRQHMMDASPGPRRLQRLTQLMAQPVLQRLGVHFKSPTAPNATETQVIGDAAAIDTLTQAAYLNTWNRLTNASAAHNPVPLDAAQFPGVTAGHFTHFINTLGGHDNALKSAAAGYVVEDQVTHHAALPATAVAQHGTGGAILDFVITRTNGPNHYRGVVDVTSSAQIGHVLDKNFNKGPFCYVGESLYPSIDFTQINGGAAPQIGVAAAVLAQAAKRERANRHLRKQLAQWRKIIELYRTGIGLGNPAFQLAAQAVSQAFLLLPNSVPLAATVAQTDVDIGAFNLHLANANNPQMPTLTQLITGTQNHYLVAGLPWW